MKEILKVYVRVWLFLIPVVFVPWMLDGFGSAKNWLLMASALVGMVLWAVGMLVEKNSTIKVNKLLLIMLLMAVWSTVSWIREAPGVKMLSIVSSLGASTMLALFLWMFLWTQVTDRFESKKQLMYLTAAGILISVTSLIVFLIPASKFPISIPKKNPLLAIGNSWSLTGSLLSEVILIAFLAIEWLKTLLKKLRLATTPDEMRLESNSYVKEAVMVIIFALIVALDIYRIVKLGWLFLDFNSAWVIAVETLKRSPIFGIGIGNFVEAFYRFRPESFNATKAWTATFAGSSMGILHYWTELGVAGLALIVWLAAFISKKIKNKNFVVAILLVATFLFLPVNMLGIFLMMWFLTTSLVDNKEVKIGLRIIENKNVISSVVSVLVILIMGVVGFFWTRILLSDFIFRSSLVAAAGNDGLGTYNKQIKAIALSNYDAEYRRIYSQTNISLAKAILSNKDRSKEDEEQAVTLVQQAVREAKAAISLNPNNTVYWLNLGSIYRDMIGMVDGAADWSFQALSQASALNPVDPNVKLDIGGMLYAAGQYDAADRLFEQAVTMKQDYPNAWYNWAYSAKKRNYIVYAIERLKNAINLVSPESGDYEKAAKELEEWNKEYEKLVKEQEELIKQQQAALQAQQKQPETLKAPTETTETGTGVSVPNSDMQPPQ